MQINMQIVLAPGDPTVADVDALAAQILGLLGDPAKDHIFVSVGAPVEAGTAGTPPVAPPLPGT